MPARPGASGLLATALMASLAAGISVAAPHPLPVALAAGSGALAVGVGATWRRVGIVLAGVGIGGASSLAVVLSGQTPVAAALACGIGCFLACELGCSGAAASRRWRASHAVDRARAAHLAAVLAVSLLVGAVALSLSRARPGGAPAELGGAVVAGVLVAVVASLARRHRHRAPGS